MGVPAYDAIYRQYVNEDFTVPAGTALTYDSDFGHYRNNMDNKLIMTFDMSDAYQAYFTFMEEFTFNDTEDYGQVEISTDGGATWITISKSTVASEWRTTKIDISRFLPAPVMIRFRMISNETGTDIGWFIDDVNVQKKIDCEEPDTTCILNPPIPDGNNGWYVSPVEITLVASDNREVAAIYYSIDGGSWQTYSAPFTVSADGEHEVSYYSVDGVGNAEEPMTCGTFKIDTTSPTASLTSPQAGYIYLFGRELMPRILDQSTALIIGGYTATATASDATAGVAYVRFSTGAGSGEDAVSPYEYNLPFYFPFGSDTLSVSVTDLAGNSANDGSVDYTKIL
jgi:hypothetical protein